MARKKNYPKKKRGFLIVNGKLRYPDIILVLLVVSLISVQLTKWVLDVGNVQNTEPQTEQDVKNNSDKSSFIKASTVFVVGLMMSIRRLCVSI